MKRKDFFGIAGVVLLGATFLIDRLIVTLPDALYFAMIGIALVLLIIGMVLLNKRRREE